MRVLVTYDIQGKTRSQMAKYRKVHKCCEKWGQMVQKSVYECSVSWEQYGILKNELQKLLMTGRDSVRIYILDTSDSPRLEILGNKTNAGFDIDSYVV